jgi:type IV secretory pathway VirB4 component
MAKKDKKKSKKKSKYPSTQAHLPIAEIRDGTVIMKDGTLRAVLITSSINFSLKSDDEQNALISAYVGFLNSIDFPLQIVVQSRKLQMGPYIENLRTLEREQQNELLRTQTTDYRSFIEELVDIGQIMTKRFYIVVPYDPLSNKKKSFWSRFKEVLKPGSAVKLKEKLFQDRRADLELRVRHVTSGLSSMNLQVVQLDTQALIELYYSTYNPDIAFAQPLSPTGKLRVEDL